MIYNQMVTWTAFAILAMFPSDTLIYVISRDGSKNFNIRTCEHMVLGQHMMGARQTKNAPLNYSSAEGSVISAVIKENICSVILPLVVEQCVTKC